MTKAKPRVLISDKISKKGVSILKKTCTVDVKPGLSEAELIKIIPRYDAQIVRAATKVTAKVIKAAKNLKIVGRAGVGVDNIDVAAATKAGILVVNSPEGNIISAAEQTIALLMALSRKTPQAYCSMKEGKWEKSKFMGSQVYQKTLGLVGFGKIGKLVAERAIGLGMNVIVSDPYANEEAVEKIGAVMVDQGTLQKESDYITFHVPKSKETYHLCSKDDFKRMKDGVFIINCSRGGVVDEEALVEAIDSGKVAAAGLDVFEKEPLPADSILMGHPNIIMTPHLGASTVEAQENVAVDVSIQISNFLNGKPVTTAVNMPAMKPEVLKLHEPYFNMVEKLGMLLEGLRSSPVKSVEILYEGEVSKMQTSIITNYFLLGMMRRRFSDTVNVVNAQILCRERGINVVEVSRDECCDISSESRITAKLVEKSRERTVAAHLIGGKEPRIDLIDGFNIDLVPEGTYLLISHTDKPGMIGKVGMLLGESNINIAGMQVGREKVRGNAVMAIAVDDDVPAEMMKKIRKFGGIRSAKLVSF
ncbi:MAG TPA: phosphoglycerate dehydrogenase [bacterium]|nr:phosphoglycerate dehydrogenase [bacterium]